MPIELSTTGEPDLNVRPGTNEATLLKFLYRHSRYGYLPKELAEETSVPYQSVQKTLDRLRTKDLVGKTEHGYYHALDDEAIAHRVAGLRSLDALSTDLRASEPLTEAEVEALPDLEPEQPSPRTEPQSPADESPGAKRDGDDRSDGTDP